MKQKLNYIFFTLISIFFITSCSNSNNIKINENLPKDKVIIYIIKRDGCPACEYQKRVLRVKEVKELLDKYCKVIKVDVRNQDSLPREWMKSYKTPTVHFVDYKFNKLIPSIGSVYPYEFRDAILKAHNKLVEKNR